MDIKEITRSRAFIIAEIGQNHQGDLDIAKELILQAKACGADAVKSQKRDIQTLLTPEEYNRPYTSINAFAATYGKHREALELEPEQHAELRDFAANEGIAFFSSPWDIPSAQLLNNLGMPIIKIPSACLTHLALLEEVATFGKPIILSSGMSTMDQIDAALEAVKNAEDVYLLQCTSSYPSSFESINLKVISEFQARYPQVTIGFSGHHRGIAVDVAAVALGAKVIERHFTLDRTMKGSDHAASLEPKGLASLVRDIRACEMALGDGIKQVYAEELPVRKKLRGPKMITQSQRVVAASA